MEPSSDDSYVEHKPVHTRHEKCSMHQEHSSPAISRLVRIACRPRAKCAMEDVGAKFQLLHEHVHLIETLGRQLVLPDDGRLATLDRH